MKQAKIQHIRGMMCHPSFRGYYRSLQKELNKLSLEALDDLAQLLREVECMEIRLNKAKRF